MIQITPPQNPQYWINQRALTFSENDLENVNRIAVSLVSGTVIMVYEKGVIDYAPDGNFQKWTLKGYSTRLVSNSAHHIYARLSRTEKDALIVFSINNYNIDGSITTIVTDANGNPVLDEDGKEQTTTSEPNPNYWYVKIGEITATVGNSKRELTYDSGALGTKKGEEESAGWNEMFELNKTSTPWLIMVKQMISSFTVKGFITLVGGFIFKDSNDVEKKVTDIKRSTDSDEDVPVSDENLATSKYVEKMVGEADDRYLKRYAPDETDFRIKFHDGLEAGNFVKGMIGGSGAEIDKDGRGEMESLTLREFLEVPELRFNRVDVVSGELWNSIAFGLVESVDTNHMICTLKLEAKERSGLQINDICRGIFADFGDGELWDGEDECGFTHLYGFRTSYFTPVSIIENTEGKFKFKYSLKPGTTQHPTESMKFAVYGNFIDKSRQASAYSTRTYKRYLNKVDTWVINPTKHIYAQYGDLEGLTIGGMTMHGYGTYQHNCYFTGTQIQFTKEQLDSLKGQDAYTAVLSDYEGVVVIDDEGNVIGGDRGMMNVVDEGRNVVTDGDNVVTMGHMLRTSVQAMRGTTPLFYSPVMMEGAYILSLNPVGCDAVVVNGVVMVTSVTDNSNCYVDITVNCEGNASFSLTYHVNAIRDGKNPIIADLDNEMDSVACDSDGKVLFGLPVSTRVSMWAGIKQLVVDKIELGELPQGVSVVVEKDAEGKPTGKVTVPENGITPEAEKVLPVRMTVYATHGNVQYHKELVFTVNKVVAGENASLYKLLPDVTSVKVDDAGKLTASQVGCKVTAADGKTVSTLVSLEGTGLSMEYYKDNNTPSVYTYGSFVGVDSAVNTITFRLLYEDEVIDVETIPVIIDGSSPFIVDLDNEMHSVSCDEEGNVSAGLPVSTGVRAFYGSKELEIKELTVGNVPNVSTDVVGTDITVTHIGADAEDNIRIPVTVTAHYGKDYTRTVYFLINKLRQGESSVVLSLFPSVSSVYIDEKGEYSNSSISCKVKRTQGKSGMDVPSSIATMGYSMEYSIDGNARRDYTYGSSIVLHDGKTAIAKTSVEFFLYIQEIGDRTLVDHETIHILKGSMGMFKSTVFHRANEEPDTPQGGSYESPIPTSVPEWTDGIPDGEEILWASTRVFYSDESLNLNTEWSIPRQMTDTASFDVEFSSVENPNPPSGHPNTNTQWSNTSGESTIWMATSTKENGVWGAWQVSKIKGEKGDKLEFDDLTDEEKESLKGENGNDAEYYTIEAAVSIIGYTMTGGYSPASFVVSEYHVKGASKTPSNRYYIHIYGVKDGASSYLGYTGNVNQYIFDASSYQSGDYDTFLFELRMGVQKDSEYVSSATVSIARQGDKGKPGAQPRYRGMFVPGNTEDPYVYDDIYRDIIASNGQIYQVYAYGSSVTDAPDDTKMTETDNDGKWQRASKYSFVAMDTALVDNANIAGFIFTREGYDDNGAPVGSIRSQSLNAVVEYSHDNKWIEDGVYRKSPPIEHSGFTVETVTFKTTEACTVMIEMSASSEAGWDKGYIGELNRNYVIESTDENGNPVYSLHYELSSKNLLVVSGKESSIAKIQVDKGEYTVQIIYTKDSSGVKNEYCVRYRFIGSPKLYLSAHTGSLLCTDVNLTGTINATSGIIGGWTIEDNRLIVSGNVSSSWANEYSNTIDKTGMHVNVGEETIKADFGVNEYVYNEYGDAFLSVLNVTNSAIPLIRQSDNVCGFYMKGSLEDLGIFIEGPGVYISPEDGAASIIKGIAVDSRSYSGTLATNMDFVRMTGNVTLPTPAMVPGKLYLIKGNSSYTLSVPKCVDTSSAYSSSPTQLGVKDNRTRMFISDGNVWYEFYTSN